MTESLTINGVSLSTWAYMAPSVAGLLTVPARRGDNVTVPGRHGAVRTPKRFEPNDVVLPLWINGAAADGSIPSGSTAAREWYKRRDELLRVLYADDLLLEFTRPDGSARSAYAQVTEVIEFERIAMIPTAQVNIGLNLYEGFWFDSTPVSQTVTGTTGVTAALTAFQDATAPMGELTLVFDGPVNNPQIAFGDGNTFIKYNGTVASGRKLLIDTAVWQVSPGTGTIWTPDPRQIEFAPGPRWLELDPSASPFEITFFHSGGGSASMSIEGRRRFLAP